MVRSAVTICLVPEAAAGPFVFHGDCAAACQTASRLGFDAVEVFAPDADAASALGLKALLGDNKLSLAALGTGAGFLKHQLTLTAASADVRARAIDYVRAMLDVAAGFGAAVIVGSMQGRWTADVPRDRAVGYLADALSTLAAHTERMGVTLLYEPLNRYETNLFTDLAAAAEFVASLGRPVKLLADLFHMNIEERDPAAALRAAGASVGHVHLADSNRRAAGFGHTDFGPIAGALRDIGYDGYASAEVLPLPDAEAAAAQTMTAFRQHFPHG
jgi:sugar phosphate isomerase/epimerase